MSTYKAGIVPDDPKDLPHNIREERARLERSLNEAQSSFTLQNLHSEPARVRSGMLVIADGSDWNPDLGPGGYRRDEANENWVFIGLDESHPEVWKAKGDGSSNDDQALTDTASASTTIRLLGKTYKHNTAFEIGSKSIFGQKSSTLYGPGVSMNPGDFYDFNLDSFNVQGTGSAGETGIYVDSGHRGVVSRVAISSYRNTTGTGSASQGLHLSNAFLNTLLSVRVQDNEYGSLTENGSNGVCFVSCTFANNDNHGSIVRGSYAVSHIACDFEFNYDGLVLDDAAGPGAYAAEPRNNGAMCCYFEGNRRAHVYIGRDGSGTTRHPYVLFGYGVANNTDYAVIVDYSDSALIGFNTFVGSYNVATYLLKSNSANTTFLAFPRYDLVSSSGVSVESGATVSDQTIQHGYDVSLLTDASGNGYADLTFSIPYESGHPPINVAFYSYDDSISSAVPWVLSPLPSGGGFATDFSGGFRVRVNGGPVSVTLKFMWRAGA